MNILIVSPGKEHDRAIAEGIAEYVKRLPKGLALSWAHPRAGSVENESAAIVKLIKEGDRVVLLDERGQDVDSQGFAVRISKELQAGTKRLVFVIGGAYGVGAEVKARADAILKLSSLTFPHMLVRLILAEQIYRASSILAGGRYHHA